MKIIHIIWSSGIGGIETQVRELCKLQNSMPGLRATLYIARNSADGLNEQECPFYEILQGDFRSGNDLWPEEIKKATRTFSLFDILHIHSFNPLIAWAARRSGKKIVYTEHGNFGFGKKKKITEKFTHISQSFFLHNWCTAITANSVFSKSILRQRYGLKEEQIHVIYNGLPSKQSYPDAEMSADRVRHADTKCMVLCIARLAGVKRIDRLIDAAATVNNAGLQIVLAGDGPLREFLEKRSLESGSATRFSFLGFRNDISSLLQQCDVTVLPSQNEAFGIAALEAWSQGKAVLSFGDSGGLAELCRMVEPECMVHSVEELSRLLDATLRQPESWNSEAEQKVRMNFVLRFSAEESSRMYLELYQKIVHVRN